MNGLVLSPKKQAVALVAYLHEDDKEGEDGIKEEITERLHLLGFEVIFIGEEEAPAVSLFFHIRP